MKSFVINDSVNDGYIVEIKNDTLEIYVPDNIDDKLCSDRNG